MNFSTPPESRGAGGGAETVDFHYFHGTGFDGDRRPE